MAEKKAARKKMAPNKVVVTVVGAEDAKKDFELKLAKEEDGTVSLRIGETKEFLLELKNNGEEDAEFSVEASKNVRLDISIIQDTTIIVSGALLEVIVAIKNISLVDDFLDVEFVAN